MTEMKPATKSKVVLSRCWLRLSILAILAATWTTFVRAGDDGGSALNIGYDGNENVTIGNYYNYTTALTIEAWIKPATTQPTQYPRIVDKYDWGAHTGYSFNIINGRLHFEMYTPDGVIHHVSGGPTITDNRWHHVAVTYDGTTARLYVDGAAAGSTDMGGPMTTNPRWLRIGSSWDNWQLRAGVDEVRIWNYACTQVEIRASMFGELQGTEAGLTGYWKFNEGSGTTAFDTTGNHNGTLTSMEAGDWVVSTAPLGDNTVNGQTDVAAFWSEVNPTASGGLTIADNPTTPFLQNVGDDIVFGHDNGTSATADDCPTGVASRWQRVWNFDKTDINANGGQVDLTFDFSDAGMGGTPSSDYFLLKRSGTSGPFSVIATATFLSGDQVLFSGVNTDDLGSFFTLGSSNPTTVELVSFTATPSGGHILLEWQTATEIDTLGFNLYRSAADEGELLRLNHTLIASQAPGSPVGGYYSFFDDTGLSGTLYDYWLEEIDVHGQATRHGPLSASVNLYYVFLPSVYR